ncbi:MAG: hypothetical protein OEZ57_02630 [Nitrospirota bacterium]|nr:hypothetical protein [Nitrospirota bacterium]
MSDLSQWGAGQEAWGVIGVWGRWVTVVLVEVMEWVVLMEGTVDRTNVAKKNRRRILM